MRRLPQINEQIKLKILLLLVEDYTIEGIMKKLNLTRGYINKYLEIFNKELYPTYLGSKKEPYYNNEDDYSKTPSYSWESLSFDEKLAYYTYEQKHKAHYD